MGAARSARLFAFVLICTGALPHTSAAQNASHVVKFVAGGAVGLGMHEAGHVLANLATGVNMGVDTVRFGPLPFFAITHHPVSPRHEFVISSAGFWSQHLSSEWLLSSRPHLRDESAPLLKGWLAFNVLASAAYAGAAFGRAGPAERDTRGMASSAGMREPWIGAWVLAPAVLDAARYFSRDPAWLRWASRAAKAGAVLLVVRGGD